MAVLISEGRRKPLYDACTLPQYIQNGQSQPQLTEKSEMKCGKIEERI
jgi:hypothetical protein